MNALTEASTPALAAFPYSWDRLRARWAIVLMSVVAGIVFGVLHDQLTARLCLEYFTIGHATPESVIRQGATVIATYWGLRAGGSAGLILGLGIALVCVAGARPAVTWRRLLVPMLLLLILCGLSSAVGGGMAYWATGQGQLRFATEMDLAPAAERGFLICLWMHTGAYAGAALGTLTLASWVWLQRLRATV
jgi:hypothetical protein